jgi:hypothetical protein
MFSEAAREPAISHADTMRRVFQGKPKRFVERRDGVAGMGLVITRHVDILAVHDRPVARS